MKAIAIIDIPDDYKGKIEDLHASTVIFAKDYYCELDYTSLKSMPQKKDEVITVNAINGYKQKITYSYGKGWNDCISEILGE